MKFETIKSILIKDAQEAKEQKFYDASERALAVIRAAEKAENTDDLYLLDDYLFWGWELNEDNTRLVELLTLRKGTLKEVIQEML